MKFEERTRVERERIHAAMSEMSNRMLAFGEIIWDVYPDAEHIGGASFNFCAHFVRMGGLAAMVSGVGDDRLGDAALEKVRGFGISDAYIQRTDKDTGRCMVTLNDKGIPDFHVLTDTAYDNIHLSDETIAQIQKEKFQALYFGTLIQRSSVSRGSLHRLLSRCSFDNIFCDVNIRRGCCTPETLAFCLDHATVLKLNRDEALSIAGERGISGNFETIARTLCHTLPHTRVVIITLDADGSTVYGREEDRCVTVPNPAGTKVVSTVGAGDSYAAAFMYALMAGEGLEHAVQKASRISNFVVANQAAVPDYNAAALLAE